MGIDAVESGGLRECIGNGADPGAAFGGSPSQIVAPDDRPSDGALDFIGVELNIWMVEEVSACQSEA